MTELIETGLEAEFVSSHIARVEQISVGMTRVYWASKRRGMWICTHTQVMPSSSLNAIALCGRDLFLDPSQISDPGNEPEVDRRH